jgi:hypothetical protein
MRPGSACSDREPRSVQEKTVFVGYACDRHARNKASCYHQRLSPAASSGSGCCEDENDGLGVWRLRSLGD